MTRRLLAIFTLASLLILSFGVVDALHIGHDHDHDDHQRECQVCYLAKIATVGVAITIALYVVFDRESQEELISLDARPYRVGHGGPKSPRAPPQL